MNSMHYNGCTAKIEFDDRDNIFVDRLFGMRTMISFHGETEAGVRKAFKVAVDAFLADCAEQGVVQHSEVPTPSSVGESLRAMK
jgi:predicted HicB family RNase H-like nuclease